MRLVRSTIIGALALTTVGCTMAGPAIKLAKYATLPPEELEKKLAEMTPEEQEKYTKLVQTSPEKPAKLLPDTERVIDAGAGEYVTATINGHPMKLRVDFEHNDIVLNAVSAARAGLTPDPMSIGHMVGGGWQIGSEPPPGNCIFCVINVLYDYYIRGDGNVSEVVIGDVKQPRNVVWSSGTREIGPTQHNQPLPPRADVWLPPNVVDGGADGLIGPLSLPENRVTLRFHPPAAGERTIELPVEGSWMRGFGLSLNHPIKLGSETIHITFAPYQPLSLASGAAGADLAALQGGHWTGETRPAPVLFGYERPVRPLALGRPLDLNGLPIRSFLTLTADWRGGRQLPPDKEADTGAIRVTGKTKTSAAYIVLSLGQDALGGCSSITHDKNRAILTLRCL